jgi:hypothetical protein
MATLMDVIMAQREMPEGSPDYTFGSRANLQPTGRPFSPDGRLGNMGFRNMMRAQQELANANIPAQSRIAPSPQMFDVLSSYGAGAPMSQPTVAAPPPTNTRQLFDVLSSYGAGAPISQPTVAAQPAVNTRQIFDVLSSYGAGAPMSQPPVSIRPMDSTFFGEDVGPRPAPMRAVDSTLAGYDMPVSFPASPPLPPRRPANLGAPTQLASAAPSVRESFMQRLLSGQNYQSNSMPVVPQGVTTPQQINFGNPDNPADFFRAERALMGLPEETLRVAGLLG